MSSRIGAALRRMAGIDVDNAQPARGADSVGTSSTLPPSIAESESAQSVHEMDSADPIQHAERLVSWLQADGTAGEVLAGDIQVAYGEMCSGLGWTELTWLRTGREFAKLTGPRRYRDVVEDDGRRRRLLAYVVPRPGEVFADDTARRKHPAAPVPMRLIAIELAIERLADQVGALAKAEAERQSEEL